MAKLKTKINKLNSAGKMVLNLQNNGKIQTSISIMSKYIPKIDISSRIG
jgi:hypothetical protein